MTTTTHYHSVSVWTNKGGHVTTVSGGDQTSASRKPHRSSSVGHGRPINGGGSSFLADTGSLSYGSLINGRRKKIMQNP